MAKRELAAANHDVRIEGRARLELEFEQPYLLGPLFGDYDRHLIMIEDRLGVNVSARGNRVMIEGDPDAAARARDVLVGLYNRLDQGQDVDAAACSGRARRPSCRGRPPRPATWNAWRATT
jgi:phosphate starvation-inducible PhoH-like protein